eukprot:SM000050S17018  [mRNA]  locus=s50:488176:489114:- [translate_table: standard]
MLCAARRSSSLRAPSPRGSVTGRPLAPGEAKSIMAFGMPNTHASIMTYLSNAIDVAGNIGASTGRTRRCAAEWLHRVRLRTGDMQILRLPRVFVECMDLRLSAATNTLTITPDIDGKHPMPTRERVPNCCWRRRTAGKCGASADVGQCWRPHSKCCDPQP